MLKEFSPHATAYAVDCKPDTLRDWRCLGFFTGLGERKGKGHRYTLSDVARIAVASVIARGGSSLKSAFALVGEMGGLIDAIVASERNAPRSTSDQFLTFAFGLGAERSVMNVRISDIHLPHKPTAIFEINLSELIRSALTRLDTFEASAR